MPTAPKTALITALTLLANAPAWAADNSLSINQTAAGGSSLRAVQIGEGNRIGGPDAGSTGLGSATTEGAVTATITQQGSGNRAGLAARANGGSTLRTTITQGAAATPRRGNQAAVLAGDAGGAAGAAASATIVNEGDDGSARIELRRSDRASVTATTRGTGSRVAVSATDAPDSNITAIATGGEVNVTATGASHLARVERSGTAAGATSLDLAGEGHDVTVNGSLGGSVETAMRVTGIRQVVRIDAGGATLRATTGMDAPTAVSDSIFTTNPWLGRVGRVFVGGSETDTAASGSGNRVQLDLDPRAEAFGSVRADIALEGSNGSLDVRGIAPVVGSTILNVRMSSPGGEANSIQLDAAGLANGSRFDLRQQAANGVGNHIALSVTGGAAPTTVQVDQAGR